jgi:hypothetical protein
MPAALRLYLWLLAGLWILVLLIGGVERHLLHWPFVYWYPFFSPAYRFTDFTIFAPRFQHFGTAAFFGIPGFPFTYPAPVALAFHGFYLFGGLALALYLGFCLAVCYGAGAILVFAMHRRGARLLDAAGCVVATFMLSYPFWFLADRANIEMVNWLALAIGVTCYWKKFWFGAATFFGLAAALKLYPAVYIALLLSARRYAAAAWGVAVAVAASAGSTFLLGPTYRVSAAGIAAGLNYFRTAYAMQLRPAEIGFDHSLFALVKLAARALVQDRGVLLDVYLAMAAALGLFIYVWKIRNLPRGNQILALTVCAIVLPPVSYDYTLINLYIPWAVLVLIAVSGGRGWGILLSLVCMAVLMAPESYLFLHGVRLAGQFKAVVLMALLAISVLFPVDESSPPVIPAKAAAAAAGIF